MTNRKKLQLSIIYTPYTRDAGIFKGILGALGSLLRAVAWRFGQRRNTGRILRSLSDYHLQDIGMTRADIDAHYPEAYSDQSTLLIR